MSVGKKDVQEYYGKVLGSSQDLKTEACCSAERMPCYLRSILSELEEEIVAKFYGCGSPVPPNLAGCRVLDLGCGSGRDCYLFSKLVGENGQVVGVDMTDEQLEVAQRHQQVMAEKFGYKSSNIDFKKGYIEQLDALDLEDNSFDLVVSNCVMNLSFDKEKLFREIFRVLKPGGELYFSDIFTSRRIPEALQQDPVLIGECIAGAFYWEDFRRMMEGMGYPDIRVLSDRLVGADPFADKLGEIELYSKTVRLFKLEGLEDRAENYGQQATYLGSIEHHQKEFSLDENCVFPAGQKLAICGNTAKIFEGSRYAKHFEIEQVQGEHLGLFEAPAKRSCHESTPTSCC